jgi:hypothetical protein
MAIAVYGLTNSAFSADSGDRLDHTKALHEKSFVHSQTSTITAATAYIHAIKGTSGTIRNVRARIEEAVATGADRTVTIDVQKSTGGGAYATVLSATIVFNNVSSLRTFSAATISSSSLTADDVLKITVAVAGAAGAQATGLIVEVIVSEHPTS